MRLLSETLADGQVWWRIADLQWVDPLDPVFAQQHGGRWNPPGSFPTLYLNEDRVTARLNLRRFIAGWPYEPEDLRDDTGPVLIGAQLPPEQVAADLHTPAGLQAAELPSSYPLYPDGKTVDHAACQAVGAAAHAGGLQGVRTRSAQTRDGGGRELAWFPADASVRAFRLETLAFGHWFWG